MNLEHMNFRILHTIKQSWRSTTYPLSTGFNPTSVGAGIGTFVSFMYTQTREQWGTWMTWLSCAEKCDTQQRLNLLGTLLTPLAHFKWG